MAILPPAPNAIAEKVRATSPCAHPDRRLILWHSLALDCSPKRNHASRFAWARRVQRPPPETGQDSRFPRSPRMNVTTRITTDAEIGQEGLDLPASKEV